MSDHPDMPSPRVSILIVAYNSAAHLPRQIEALSHSTVQDFEVILLDNASRGQERPNASALPPNWRLLQMETNLGFAAGNNRAAGIANAPMLALLNPDAFPRPGWLAALLAAAEADPCAAAIGSTQIRANDPQTFDGLGDVLFVLGLPYRSGYGVAFGRVTPQSGETFSPCGAAMLVRRDAFNAVGGFDERFFCYGEDVDLGFRLRLHGWRCVQAADAIVDHVGGGSSDGDSAFADFHGARNRLWSFLQNMPGVTLWLLLPAHLLATLLVLIVQSFRGRHAGWRGFGAGLSGWSACMARRSAVQSKRRASIGAILRSLAWNPAVLFGRHPVIRAPGSTPCAAMPVRRADR